MLTKISNKDKKFSARILEELNQSKNGSNCVTKYVKNI